MESPFRTRPLINLKTSEERPTIFSIIGRERPQGQFLSDLIAKSPGAYRIKGTADIRGGRFSVQQKDATHPTGYVINCFDANYQNGTAIVKISGGRYHGFNPADCPAEGPGTNFVIAGYQSQAYGIDGEGYTIYKVTSL